MNVFQKIKIQDLDTKYLIYKPFIKIAWWLWSHISSIFRLTYLYKLISYLTVKHVPINNYNFLSPIDKLKICNRINGLHGQDIFYKVVYLIYSTINLISSLHLFSCIFILFLHIHSLVCFSLIFSDEFFKILI